MNNLLTTTANKRNSLINIYKLKGNGLHLVVMLNDLQLRLLISLLNGTFTEAYRIEADTCDHYQEAKLMNLSVGKQVSEGELHAKKR